MTAVAREVVGFPPDKKHDAKREDKRFCSFFGAPILVITHVWNLIQNSLVDNALPKCTFWAHVFLHVYSTEEVHCRIVGMLDPGTFRKWCWCMLEKIAVLKIEIIKLDNRFEKWDGAQCLMSIDGVDCMVMEPWPFDSKMYSQKFNGPGVKCEVGVCIKTGHVVWLNGPFVASSDDAAIFKETLANLLADDEGVEVDAGCKGHDKFKAPVTASSRVHRKEKSVVRGRHENINSRLKIFNVLNVPFRHTNPRDQMMRKHGLCVDVIALTTQLKFELAGETLYDVKCTVTCT